MARVYVFANQKGGVGKTTTAVNVGAFIAAHGHGVLIVDVDPQANATSMLGLDKYRQGPSIYNALIDNTPLSQVIQTTSRPRLHVVPSAPQLAGAEVEMVEVDSRESLLSRSIDEIAKYYDYIFIDTPPSLGLLTVNALCAARNGVVIPVQCEYLALEGLSELVRTIELVRENINDALRVAGVVLTMYDVRTNLSQQVVEEVRRYFTGSVFDTIIPRNVRLSEAPSYGETIISYAPTSPGGVAYMRLAKEFLAREQGEPKAEPEAEGEK